MASDDIRSAQIAASGEHLVRQPLALGAETDGRRALERIEAGTAVGDESGTGRRRGADIGPDNRLPEDRAHARPHRLRRERVGAVGTEHQGAAEQRVSGADDGPDVPRVADPVQVEAGRAPGLRPTLRPDRNRPRAGAEGRSPSEQLGIDLLAAEAAAGCGQQQTWLDSRGEAGLEQILALGDECALALAVLALVQLAHQLQLLVVGALDHRFRRCGGFLVVRFFSWNKKSGP